MMAEALVMKKFLFYLIQWTWAFPINFIGLLGYLIFAVIRGCRHERFYNATVTYVPGNWGGISFGTFIFMREGGTEEWSYDTRIHEYGHTWQALLLGPLWFLVIAIPSFIWCNFKPCINYRKKNNVSYYSLYCEGWANAWGQRFTGLRQKNTK